MNKKENFICPVCGYDGLDEPPYDEHGCSSFEICPSCGTEYGYQDCGRPHSELRSLWIESGMNWHSRHVAKPDNWDSEKQLLNVRRNEQGTMTVTRINNFEAAPGGGEALKEALIEILPAMKSATGFQSYEILQALETPEKIAVIETWDSVEDHKAAASAIAPDDFKRVMALIAGAPTGAYYSAAD